ncbi:hypothetical protein ACIPUC_00705 [Streptomyces sp. LARHCF249]
MRLPVAQDPVTGKPMFSASRSTRTRPSREGPAPPPAGPQAPAAVDARNAMTELLYDLY